MYSPKEERGERKKERSRRLFPTGPSISLDVERVLHARRERDHGGKKKDRSRDLPKEVDDVTNQLGAPIETRQRRRLGVRIRLPGGKHPLVEFRTKERNEKRKWHVRWGKRGGKKEKPRRGRVGKGDRN